MQREAFQYQTPPCINIQRLSQDRNRSAAKLDQALELVDALENLRKRLKRQVETSVAVTNLRPGNISTHH